MNRLVFITGILLYCSSVVFSQPAGNGTSASPYSGTISSNTTWIPSDYPNGTIYALDIVVSAGAILTISPGTYNGGLVQFYGGYSLTIGSGSTVIINPRTSVTVDDIYNSGVLRLESFQNEEGVASLIHDTYDNTGGGVSEVRLFLSGGTAGSGGNKWHYVSVPFSNVSASTFNTLNLAQYIEGLVTGPDNYPGWIALDGYQYSSGLYLPAYAFTTLTLAKGYNYYDVDDNTFTFTGTINVSNRSVPVTSGTGYPDFQGYNLIGNPFASCLDWDYLIANFPPAFVNNAIYFTNNGTISSYVGGIGDNGGTSIIPPLQGFFIKTEGNTNVSLRAAARTHFVDQLRYKKGPEELSKSSDTISFVRLMLENSTDTTDLVVRFNEKATSGVDKLFDAYEFSKTTGAVNIWTTIGNVSYGINGLPFPETKVEIPVGLYVKNSGTFRLSLSELNKLDSYNVILKDNFTNKKVNLKQGGIIEFSGTAGTIENRFILAISNASTAIQEIPGYEKKFDIISFADGEIKIIPLTDEILSSSGSIIVYDLMGRKVFQNNWIEWNSFLDLKLNSSQPGLYIIEITAGSKKFIEKVILQ